MGEKLIEGKPPQQGKHARRNGTGTLGPVQHLEEHVTSQWWREAFSALYLKTDGDVVTNDTLTRREVDMFSSLLHLSPGQKVLDLCCGQGRHVLELARRGYGNCQGLDRSHYLIRRAKSQAKKEGLSVVFREGDARRLPYNADVFDSVLILGNSFGYFETPQEDLQVLREVFRVMKPWGQFLIDVADGEYLRMHYEPRSWEWIDKKRFVCRERTLSRDKQRLVAREVITHVERGVIADQFYALRLYSRGELMDLLAKAGFKDITFQGKISDGDQFSTDPGMMKQRIVVTSKVRKRWTAQSNRRTKPRANIAVVLGDPTMLDILKPSYVFDEDDIYTIDQMKAALNELHQYKFAYLSNHKHVIDDLRALTGKTDMVLNLCDEGLYNDPRKELHIAALLESLGLPYTGAGPQCLSYCYDKSLVRGVAKEMGIPVPDAFLVTSKDIIFELNLTFPVIAKPNFGDSSFGITQNSVACDIDQLINTITDIRQRFGYEKPIIVEEYLQGKDLSMGIIGNPPESYTALPIIEEDYSKLPPYLPPICGYEAKWLPHSPYANVKSIPAQLPEDTEKAIVAWCTQLFERLECRDYARFDWRLDGEGRPRLLEVNPNPGWCWDGHLAKMAHVAGISYPQMLEAIIQAAHQRLCSHE